MQTLNQHHRECRIRRSSLLNVKSLMYSITYFHLTEQSIKPPERKELQLIIKSFSNTNRIWQGFMFVMEKLSSFSEPLLWQPPWWPHPSSPTRAAGGPGHALCLPPAPVPGWRSHHITSHQSLKIYKL